MDWRSRITADANMTGRESEMRASCTALLVLGTALCLVQACTRDGNTNAPPSEAIPRWSELLDSERIAAAKSLSRRPGVIVGREVSNVIAAFGTPDIRHSRYVIATHPNGIVEWISLDFRADQLKSIRGEHIMFSGSPHPEKNLLQYLAKEYSGEYTVERSERLMELQATLGLDQARADELMRKLGPPSEETLRYPYGQMSTLFLYTKDGYVIDVRVQDYESILK